jgi:3-hydroxybutyryl-CoA dehydrogenase
MTIHISKVGVIGAGQMGLGISALALERGFSVSLWDGSPSVLAVAQERLLSIVIKSLQKQGKEFKGEDLETRLKICENPKEFASCQLVIEAIVENLDVKRKLFEDLSGILSPQTILCSNTSSLSINQLSSFYEGPFLGLHFMNPPTRIRFVEIIPSPNSSPNHIKEVSDFAEAIGCSQIISKDIPGFIVNRILFGMMGLAMKLSQNENIAPQDIDKALEEGAHMPMGPFKLADHIGLDTCKFILEELWDKTREPQFRPSAELLNKVNLGELGKKSGRGFYIY